MHAVNSLAFRERRDKDGVGKAGRGRGVGEGECRRIINGDILFRPLHDITCSPWLKHGLQNSTGVPYSIFSLLYLQQMLM